YLYNNNIYYLFNIDTIEKISSNKKIRYNLKQRIINHINNIKHSSTYLKLFILGDNTNLNKDILDNYRLLGISHLFAVSGMHISILTVILLKLLKKIKISEFYRYILVIIFILFYMFLTDYSASILRAAIFFILLSINKYYYFNIKTINLLLLTLIINIFINPYIIYNVGFQFSYIISLYLILFQDLITKQNNYFSKLLMVSSIAFLTSFPIVIYNFFQINLLSIVYNLLFVPLVSLIIFPLSLIVFIFPFLDKLLYIFTKLMEYLSFQLIKINSTIILSKPNLFIVLIYYLLITYVLYSIKKGKKYPIVYLLLFILFHYFSPFFNPNTYLTMIDVGQGDSILIRLSHNRGNILIDTGGDFNYRENWQIKNKEYSLGCDTLIPYFKSLGIRKIDYLIITHGHIDHMGEANNIINNFKVEKVIFNKAFIANEEKNIIYNLSNQNIPHYFYGAGDNLTINKQTLYFLNPTNKEKDLNDNSLVIYTELNNNKVLLMGDASTTIENRLLARYKINDLFILKVSHHGSISGTSETLLDYSKPKYALVSVGLNNKFKHPHKEVLDRLKERGIKTYITSRDGSIQYIFSKRAVTVKVCPA
ncbi:MAG: DNA internalization-related competence protein ComEC/Rec2, partial [Bacilli bacterium]|nr:DNA internalization-related competence protein ComEC/Rec2 [Bacilli bacterium]